MIKKEYMKPTMQVVKVQQSQIICVSVPEMMRVKSSGLDNPELNEEDLQYDDNGGELGNAW